MLKTRKKERERERETGREGGREEGRERERKERKKKKGDKLLGIYLWENAHDISLSEKKAGCQREELL